MVSKKFALVCPAILLWVLQIVLAPAGLCSVALGLSCASAQTQEKPDSHSTSAQGDAQPRCQTTGTRKIAIACDYTPLPVDSAPAEGQPQIALNHAEFTFKTNDDNWMHLELKLTNLDKTPIPEARRLYIEVNDDSGQNLVRRPLPGVNLASLAPGQSADFKERLVFPALQPGHYKIALWIPSADPAFKFKATHNWLIRSVGVADSKSGMNAIAAFSVSR